MRTIAGSLLVVAGAICFAGGAIAQQIRASVPGPSNSGGGGIGEIPLTVGLLLGILGLVVLAVGFATDGKK